MNLVADLIPDTIAKFTETTFADKTGPTDRTTSNGKTSSAAMTAVPGIPAAARPVSRTTTPDTPHLDVPSQFSPEIEESADAASRTLVRAETGAPSSPGHSSAVSSSAVSPSAVSSPVFHALAEETTVDCVEVWHSCLKQIRQELDSQIFSAWIRPLRLIEAKRKAELDAHSYSVVVAATNKFALEHVQRHYSECIAAALATALSADALALSFRVERPAAASLSAAPGSAGQRIGNTPISSSANSTTSSAGGARSGTTRDGGTQGGFGPVGGAPGGGAQGGPKSGGDFSSGDTRSFQPQHRVSPGGRPGHGEETNLNPKYNFSNFVVGSCNQFAHAASLRVSEMPGCNYNPLFIYGGVGLGKTHLANAIGNSTRRQNKKALLVTSEAFVSELIAALRSNRMQQFKEKFRTLDLLIIDDIQFIIGKERTQEEFFHTFNDLYNRRKQIIITSDTVPQELAGVEERLRTRFACGLAVDLQAPDLETRVAILTKKAEAAGVFLNIDIARYIADAINTNVRELEGAFNRLQAMSSLQTGSKGEIAEVSLELAQEVVRDFRPRRQVEVTTELIQRMVAERYNVSITDLLGKRRTHNVALARQVAMYLCRKLTTYSYPEIGAYFGGRDHSTVIHSYRTVEDRAAKDKELSEVLEGIQRTICG